MQAGPVINETREEPLPAPSTRSCLEDILPGLGRLDELLRRAITAAEETYGRAAATDPYRGLYVSPDEAQRLLSREPCVPLFAVRDDTAPRVPAIDESPLESLRRRFGLSDFDLDLVLIALAPELDLRYERLYGYLQDDVTRRRPTVDLVLDLLCPSAEARVARRAHFAPDAPLIGDGLLHLVPDPNHVQPPLLAYYLKLDEQIVRLLLGQEGLDSRLVSFCRLLDARATFQDLAVKEEINQALAALASRCRKTGDPLSLYFYGASGSGKRAAAEAVASESGTSLLVVDVAQVPDAKADFEQTIKLLFREARLQDAVLYLDGLDALVRDDRAAQYRSLLDAVAEHDGIAILAGTEEWVPPGRQPMEVIPVAFATPDFALRRACWHTRLAAAGIGIDAEEIDALASRFRLNPGQIAEAVATASRTALWRAAAQPNGEPASESALSAPQPATSDLFAAARAQCGHDLAKLARKVAPKYNWDDIVLPPDQLAQLREVCNQARYRQIVYGEWGFDRKLSLGKGLNVLFSGPPGTGKTMAAEVIASELQLDLYKIDLSQVVSKYIGETEKNLDRIFTAAGNANAILFFDEADALFGKRSEVKDAHDRYANIEIGYLLQKMEEYEGVAILATNLRQNLDEAFVRRIQIIVEFPFPDEEYRRRIWEVIFPRESPLGGDVDYRLLAREVKLAGGNIKNIALAAAFCAAADGQVIRMPHLVQAARREHQKLGRTWDENGGTAAGELRG